jgi:hypothetical protein
MTKGVMDTCGGPRVARALPKATIFGVVIPDRVIRCVLYNNRPLKFMD